MKQRIPLIGALLTVASAGLAMGCGCASERPRLAPVREMIVERSQCVVEKQQCIVQRPLAVREYTCAAESRPDFGAPFRTIGHVFSAPFIALGNAFSPSDRYIAPVGERFGNYSTVEYEKVRTIHTRRMLRPVGERFITSQVILTEPDLQPVGERFITVKRYHKAKLHPVGERSMLWKSYHKTTLKPVGERSITLKRYQKAKLQPVGEQFISGQRKVMLKQQQKKQLFNQPGSQSLKSGSTSTQQQNQ